MKTNPFKMLVFACAILPFAASAQTPSATPDTNAPSAPIGIDQAITDLQSNPDTLFQKLDTNNDGNLSREEFGRMGPAGSQGNSGTPAATPAPAPAPTRQK